MAVLVVLLAAMLFVGAASAAAANNGTVFVNQIINYSAIGVNDDAQDLTFYKVSGDATPVVIDEFTIANNSRILPSVIGENTGVWYNEPNPDDATFYISIYYPEIFLSAELVNENDETDGDSINGKTINTKTKIQFIIDAPRVGPAYNESKGFAPEAKILFTTPAGGKTYVFGTEADSLNTDNAPVKLDEAQVNTTTVKAGEGAQAGAWTAQAEFSSPESFKNYAEKSNTINFTLQSTTLVVTAAQDSVIRSNPFTITISGNANAYYNVTIENPESDSKNNPFFQPGQNGMKDEILNNDDLRIGYQFTTDASGQRTVQFNTNESTEDKTFTIRVTEALKNAKKTNANWDEVKVKVEKGAVTISASGDGSYYIGTEITLSGTNTDSDSVYLFITGPNLKANGEKLLELGKSADDGGSLVSVKTDNTWEKKWNTAGSGLDTGAYTIYATSSDVGKDKLSETEYATVSVSLKQPFLSAVPSGTIVAKGDDIYIRGTAEGEPNDLKIYIFGPNKFVNTSVNVEDDSTYEKKIKIDSDWASNQYFVVIQHPMYNGKFDADLNKSASYPYFYIKKGSNAADALTKMIDNANIDDIYTKLTFTVTEPRIDITNPGDQGVGTKFTISGTTNLAVDDQIIVEVQSSSFEAVDKTSSSITDGVSVTTKVVAGEGVENTWSVEVDTTNWKLDEYTIKASGIEVDVTATTNFNLVEQVATPTATATGAPATATRNPGNSGLRRIRCTRRTWCSSTARPPPQLKPREPQKEMINPQEKS